MPATRQHANAHRDLLLTADLLSIRVPATHFLSPQQPYCSQQPSPCPKPRSSTGCNPHGAVPGSYDNIHWLQQQRSPPGYSASPWSWYGSISSLFPQGFPLLFSFDSSCTQHGLLLPQSIRCSLPPPAILIHLGQQNPHCTDHKSKPNALQWVWGAPLKL